MMMDWNRLLTSQRYTAGDATKQTATHDRSQFQRDYDRLIFSAPFRRLQNKTQVFPIPGNIFVHNRLTHSLEVASVGRSLGNKIAQHVKSLNLPMANPELLEEIGTIVGTACLAHDLGNPPFGHSGEEAISYFFTTGKGKEWKERLTETEWHDLTHFEGNANAFRLLTHTFTGRRPGGYAMTYSTLATVVKYPFESTASQKGGFKYGFFQSEKSIFAEIAEATGLIQLSSSPLRYARHPLVYAMEAADDICYQIMDIEDAHKLKLLTYQETEDLLRAFCSEDEWNHVTGTFQTVSDRNEKIAYLRSIIINSLINNCAHAFVSNYAAIMDGTFQGSLIAQLPTHLKLAYDNCTQIAQERIYHTGMVTQILLAGYRIFATILDEYIHAMFTPESYYSKNLLLLMPGQYHLPHDASDYAKIQTIVDYVSGMTDSYALDLYRKLQGIELPAIG
ncbi:MAG: deoxyguanosinetriphosphate triphosphohydrolase [Marinifilaceae bacterium]